MKKGLAVFTGLILVSCATSPVEQKLRELMDQAEIAVKEGQWDQAKMKYEEALKLNSSYTPAKFGYIISDSFGALAEIQESIQIILPILQMIAQAQQPQAAYGINYIIKNFLESALIGRLRNHLLCNEQGDKYRICFDEIEKDPGFSYTVSSIPLVVDIGFGPVISLDFGGTYELPEVYFFEFLFATLTGLAEIIYTVDIQIDIVGAFGFIFNSGIMDMLSTQPLPAVLKILGTLLNANKNLIGFNGNMDDLLGAQTHLQVAFESLALSIEEGKKRPIRDDTISSVGEEQDVIVWRFTNNIQKNVETRCSVREKAGRNICVHLTITQSFVEKVERIARSFDDPQFFISWVDDIAPFLATTLQIFLDSGLVLDVVNFATSLISLDEETKRTIDSLKGFLAPGSLSADLIYGVLTAIIGDIIQIAPAKIVEEVKNGNFSLRKLLPIWTSYFDYSKGYPKTVTEADTLWLEWECGSSGTSTVPPYYDNRPDVSLLDSQLFYLVCSKDHPPSDSQHFTDSNVKTPIPVTSLPKDGISSQLPYFYLPDPTFAGAVMINFKDFQSIPTCNSSETEMKTWHVPKDNCEINGLIHTLVGQVIELLRQGQLPF